MDNLKLQYNSSLEMKFDEIKLQYEKIDIDDDLNYIISYKAGKLSESFGMIEMLLFYSFDSRELVGICPNIYVLKKNDSTLSVLNALNKANTKLSNGSVTLDNDKVSYRCIEQFESPDNISVEDIRNVLNDVVAAIIYTYEEIKGIKKNEK